MRADQVRAHLEESATGRPIEHVTLRVIPPIRYFPTFPTASGQTDHNGDALLRLPRRETLWQCRFTWEGRVYSVPFDVRNGAIQWSGPVEAGPVSYEPGPNVRLHLVPLR